MPSIFKNTKVNNTSAIKLPSGTTAQRPGQTVVQFTSTGSDTWTCPSGVNSIELLVVAGGGAGGGSAHSGGGGAGGLVHKKAFSVTPGTTYDLEVGTGGTGILTSMGGSGKPSIFGGSNLITNGTFDSDTSGWTASNSILARQYGMLKITRDGGTGVTAYQDITTEVGKTYFYAMDMWALETRGGIDVLDSGSTAIHNSERVALGDRDYIYGYFTATTTTTRIAFNIDDNTKYILADNIIVCEENAVFALGGGGGGGYTTVHSNDEQMGFAGGSGGGGDWEEAGRDGFPNQGNRGGHADSINVPNYTNARGGGGGGGAGGSGGSLRPASSLKGQFSYGGNGGIGLALDITGTTTYYAGGGGGGGLYEGDGWNTFPGEGGLGGGGRGGKDGAGQAGAANTGGGGGGTTGTWNGSSVNQTDVGASGGSGIIIIRYYADADAGSYRYNTDLNYTEIFDGANWKPFTTKEIKNKASVKTIEGDHSYADNNGYRIHTFFSGDHLFTPEYDGTVEVLVVGGGGGAGGTTSDAPGGGGGGGVIYEAEYPVYGGYSYGISVGSGGQGGRGRLRGYNGHASSFGSLNALGGGGGGTNEGASPNNNGRKGASGGGGGSFSPTGAGGASEFGQGFPGGAGSSINPDTGGGGGGAGGPGVTGQASIPASGGPGLMFDISGEDNWYGGGGAGGVFEQSGLSASGGVGGGGDLPVFNADGQHGKPNTGGGGGAARRYTGSGTRWGGDGGSGIVIVKYKTNLSSPVVLEFEAGSHDWLVPSNVNSISLLVVGAGGGGGTTGGGGGAGGVIYYENYTVTPGSIIDITVGSGGAGGVAGGNNGGSVGDNSLFGTEITAGGGGGGGSGTSNTGTLSGANGGGAGRDSNTSGGSTTASNGTGYGHAGGGSQSTSASAGGGGGGAGSTGATGITNDTSQNGQFGGTGGKGVPLGISGINRYYGGGGGGGQYEGGQLAPGGLGGGGTGGTGFGGNNSGIRGKDGVKGTGGGGGGGGGTNSGTASPGGNGGRGGDGTVIIKWFP